MKKVFSLILCLALMIGLLPATEVRAAVSATTASLNSTINVKLSSSTDVKMYKVTTPEAGRLTVEVATSARADDYAITATLKDEDGKIVVDPQTGSAFSMPSYGTSVGDTFYLVIEDAYRGYDTTFKVTFTFSYNQNWESENNDTSDKADFINAGTKYYGSISKSSDLDFYRFNLMSAKKVNMVFGPAVIDGQNRTWDVDLFNEDGESLDVFETGSKNDRTLTLKKGTYYIRVAGNSGTSLDGTVSGATGGDYYLSFTGSKVSVKKPKVTGIKLYGTESWLYDNYATATVSIKNAGKPDGFTLRISRSSNMKSGTKKKNYAISSANGVTAKKIRSKLRMGIYPAYYVQVRGYVNDAFGGKIYGKYSAIKSGSLSDRDYNDLK